MPLSRMRAHAWGVGGACLLLLAGCMREPRVPRFVDGRVVEGPYVPPDAYAAYLRGALAEETGDARGARAAYAEAIARAPADPGLYAKLAEVECRIDAASRRADEALSRAFALDPTFAGAWRAKALCEAQRGNTVDADTAAAHAEAAEPLADDLALLRVKVATARSARAPAIDAGDRNRLIALTLVHAQSPVAWEALATWARAHGDARLFGYALTELARRAPGMRPFVAEGILHLAGEGELSIARRAAGILVDASREGGLSVEAGMITAGGGVRADRWPLVAHLAVDDAILSGEVDRARSRATRTHLGLAAASGRALLAGRLEVARALAEPLVAADPGSVAGRMALAVAARDSSEQLASLFRVPPRQEAPAAQGATEAAHVPAPVVLAFALHLASTVDAEGARFVLERSARMGLTPGDALTTGAAVELAARGLLNDRELPIDARVELAARRGELPPPEALDPTCPHLDARHAYLALALAQPTASRTRELGERLKGVREVDPIVAVAWARVALAGGDESVDPAWLLGRAPADPLVASTALALAARQGEKGVAARARAALGASARTPAERAGVEAEPVAGAP